eukprot:7376648-Prymnesium_polylepis.1
MDRPTYPQLGRACWGSAGERCVWFGMVAMTVGVVGSYLDFVGQILADLIAAPDTFGQGACVLLSAIPAALLSLLRSTRTLSYFSGIGLVALVVACIAVLHDALTRPDAPLRPISSYSAFRLHTYPLFLGNAAYLYLISTAILPLEQSMASRGSFHRAFTVAQCMVTVPNVAFGSAQPAHGIERKTPLARLLRRVPNTLAHAGYSACAARRRRPCAHSRCFDSKR